MCKTREKLLEVARDLFVGRGYGVVGTSEICRAARVNKGTFYHFFPSKAELLIAAMDRYAEEFRQAFVRIAASKKDPRDKLEAVFEVPAQANRDWKKAHGFAQGCLVGNMTLELATVEHSVRAAVLEAMKSWRYAIEPIIVELMDEGQIPAIAASEGADVVIALMQGGNLLAKAQNNPECISALSSGAIGALAGIANGQEAGLNRLVG